MGNQAEKALQKALEEKPFKPAKIKPKKATRKKHVVSAKVEKREEKPEEHSRCFLDRTRHCVGSCRAFDLVEGECGLLVEVERIAIGLELLSLKSLRK